MPNVLHDPSIPILGRSLVVDGYTIAIAARCQCKSGGTYVAMSVTCSSSGTAVAAGVCSACGLGYSVQGMELDQQAQLSFQCAVLSATPKDS